MDQKVSQAYAIKVATILNAAEQLTSDLDYLCSLVEKPDVEFPIANALAYAQAVTALSSQLDFILEDIAENELSKDGDCVKITKEDILTLNMYTENSEDALKLLEKTCGISLKSN